LKGEDAPFPIFQQIVPDVKYKSGPLIDAELRENNIQLAAKDVEYPHAATDIVEVKSIPADE